MELGGKFWLALIAGCLAVAVGGLILFAVIGWAWYAWGFVGTFALIAVVMIGVGYVYDRRHQKDYESITD